MTKNQFLALWNLKTLNEQAYQKYKDYDYALRQRVLRHDAAMSTDDFTYQNLLRKDEWYDRWQFKVENHISSFREFSPNLLLRFQNVDLGDWTDTLANRLEKQMIMISKTIEAMMSRYGLTALHKTHFDASSKQLYILQIRDRQSWKVRTVDFSRTKKQSIVLEAIYADPLEHHDFSDLELRVDPSGEDAERDPRMIYFIADNINRKINKTVGSKMDLLESKQDQVWVYHLHI